MTEANIGDADGPKGERQDAVSKSIVSFMHFEATEWIPDIAARFRDDVKLLSSFPRRRESSDLFWRDVSKSLDPGYRFAIPG